MPEVDLVVNFDVPYISIFSWKEPDYANYRYRVERPIRFYTDGIAVSFVVEEDETENEIVDKIEKFYSIEIK